jgi:hypothetical protein
MDPRTRDAGKARVESLAQYRQLVGRLAKLSLSREQMEQLSPAIGWAQAGGEPGQKFMAALEKYFDVCGKWDALVPQGSGSGSGAVSPLLRRAYDDLVAHFAKERTAFWIDATKAGSATSQGNGGDLETRLGELVRLHGVMDDVFAMNKSFDTLNAFKPRPVGGLEKKAQIAALAAASNSGLANRTDGEKFLKAVRRLAELAQKLSAQPLSGVPSPVAQAWAGGKAELFEARWKGIVLEQTQSLAAGAIDLDARAARLETALVMGEALRAAAELEAGLPKADALSRWVDWGADVPRLRTILDPYKQAMSAAFAGFATDQLEAVEQWNKMRGRYQPLIALINRDAAYAEQCERMPIGFAADVARLATAMEGGPFGTERFAGYAVGVWAALERSGEEAAADRVAVVLARRLAKDLGISTTVEDTIGRGTTRKAKAP